MRAKTIGALEDKINEILDTEENLFAVDVQLAPDIVGEWYLAVITLLRLYD